MKNNPFCLTFGKEPDRYVERTKTFEQITETFLSESPSFNHYLITGVRGSGKTVLQATIANLFREKEDWVVISLNPVRDMLQMLAASLYEDQKLQAHFLKANLNLSKFGIGINLTSNPPISDIQIAIEKMVQIIAGQEKRLLITIDDVTKSNNLIAFASAFQDLIMKRYPVFLLMTGLYENVYLLQNDNRVSFLLRAEKPTPVLEPLGIIGMKNQYMQTFQISEEDALQMAKFTKGYSYAFQSLGYIMWEKECTLKEAIPFFDERMAEYCYDKIWDDCSPSEKKLITGIVAAGGKVRKKNLLEAVGLNEKSFSTQRDRLIKKGLIDGSEYGYVSLALPRFDVYVKSMADYD